MTRIAIAPDKFRPGFKGPGPKKAVKWLKVVPLESALLDVYKTDAHLVSYYVNGVEYMPRVTKEGLPYFGYPLIVECMFCDIDNPRHAPWNDELRDNAFQIYESAEILQTAGIYHTTHGSRIVQPIEKPILVQEIEPYTKRWLRQLQEVFRQCVDTKCADWTRHFRLPNVRRSGRNWKCPYINIEKMKPIALEPIAEGETIEFIKFDPDGLEIKQDSLAATPKIKSNSTSSIKQNSKIKQSLKPGTNVLTDIPEEWHSCIEPIAQAISAISTEWHTLFMALAGALLSRGVPSEHVPALCRAISIATNRDTKTNDRITAARTTIQKYLSGGQATGYSALVREWPAVAIAVDAALPKKEFAEVFLEFDPEFDPKTIFDPEQLDERDEYQKLADIGIELQRVIENTPQGLSIVQSDSGLGKTSAVIQVALNRQGKPYAMKSAAGERAPPNSQTAISVKRHSLAIEIQKYIPVDTRVQRVFGPLSLKDLSGKPVCKYHKIACPLVEGGQTMQWELCEGRQQDPCEFNSTCIAKNGVEGPDDARIFIGSYGMVARLDKLAGKTGLLIIDGLPELLETTIFTHQDFAVAMRILDSDVFEDDYGMAMRPGLLALRAYLEQGPINTPTSMHEAIRAFAKKISELDLDRAQYATGMGVDCTDVVKLVTNAHSVDPNTGRPAEKPPKFWFRSILEARKSPEYAANIGLASKVLNTIYRSVISQFPVVVRVENTHSLGRTLIITRSYEHIARALKREGSTVMLMNKDAGLAIPIIEKLVGYKPPISIIPPPDGAQVVERTYIRSGAANSRRWFKNGQLVIGGSFVQAVRAVFDWAREDDSAEKLGLITMQVPALAIAASLQPENETTDEKIIADWKKAGQKPAALETARSKLGPMVREWPGQVTVRHYYSSCENSNLDAVDCLVTLGDPWPNIENVRNEVAYLGDLEALQERAEALCGAELEAAHKMLGRTARAYPARALHLGNILPTGNDWVRGVVEFRKMKEGRPRNEGTMTADEVAKKVEILGGVRRAAQIIGCSCSMLSRYQTGQRAIPAELGERLSTATLVQCQS